MIIYTVIALLFVLIIHEAGHALAILLTHAGRIKGFVLNWKGIGVKWSPYSYEPVKRVVVSLAGSYVNLVLAAVFYIAGFELLGLANLTFGVANLLPLPNSDGLRAVAHLKEAG